jgi:hypothetical protein
MAESEGHALRRAADANKNGCSAAAIPVLVVAAAPDLLAALTRFIESLERGKASGLKPSWDGWATVAWEARAAIKKARGG